MTRDTYERALKSAAQIALVSLAAGCGGAMAPESEAVDSGTSARAEDPQSRYGKDASSKGDAHGTLTNATCKDDLAAAYPDGDPNWYAEGTPRKPTPVSDATLVQCCHQLYSVDGRLDEMSGIHESGCCSLLKATHATDIGIACTPWGPPMPVAARTRRRSGAVA